MVVASVPWGVIRAPAAHRRVRLQWHRLYYLLAAFDLFTVLVGLAINHQVRNQFARSVEVNQVWAERLADYSELGKLAQSVNAPGNDVFDSLAVDAESSRMQVAIDRFNTRLRELRAELQTNAGPAESPLVDDFDALAEAMGGMTLEADLIFSYFAQNQNDMAGRRMATMDRKYATVNNALARVRDDVTTIQQQNLSDQEAIAQSLAKFDLLMAGFIVLMVSAATLYGHNMARRVQADARERERYLGKLQDVQARTQSILDTAADGIITCDERGIVESANSAAVRLFAGSGMDLVGHHLSMLVPQSFLTARPDALAQLVAAGGGSRERGAHLEILARRLDGTSFPAEVAMSELRLGDGPRFTAIVRDITERKRADEERARLYGELAERERRLEGLVGRLLLAQEDERRRIAYDIHDGLAQVAAAAQQHLEAFTAYCRPRSPRARHELEQALELSCRTVREGRRVIAGLRPTVLDDFGLVQALRLEVEALIGDGWAVSYHDGMGPDRLTPIVETALFRVGQEALRNVRKHAGVTRVHVSLSRRGTSVRLAVQDWGRGFMPAAVVANSPSERVGLAGMQERIALLGGRCLITSRPGAGTRIRVDVPVTAEASSVHAA
jgi:PAS domain S-box-containing protein